MYYWIIVRKGPELPDSTRYVEQLREHFSKTLKSPDKIALICDSAATIDDHCFLAALIVRKTQEWCVELKGKKIIEEYGDGDGFSGVLIGFEGVRKSNSISYGEFECIDPEVNYNLKTVSDIDGNTYDTINIGDQVWMSTNYRATKCSDGSPLLNYSKPFIEDYNANVKYTDGERKLIKLLGFIPIEVDVKKTKIVVKQRKITWSSLKKPAYCSFNNLSKGDFDSSSIRGGVFYKVVDRNKCGLYYNYHAIVHPLFAPPGWHVPTLNDYNVLRTHLVGKGTANDFKSIAGWFDSGSGSNKFGFNALPFGDIQIDKDNIYISGLGSHALWWGINDNATNKSDYSTFLWSLSADSVDLYKDLIASSWSTPVNGMTVRLIKNTI